MVKFRCLRCSQKIVVNDEGIGVVIACPTCADRLIVPPQTDAEFLTAIGVVSLEPVATEPVSREAVRGALIPHLARLMMDRFLQLVLHQRQELLTTQAAAADQIAAIEQRETLVQCKLQRRLAYYESRIATLTEELESKEAENRQLQQRNRQLIVQIRPAPLGVPPRAARVKLHTSLLMGA